MEKQTIGNRIKHAWSVFKSGESSGYSTDLGYGSGIRQDRRMLLYTSTKSVVAPVYNRISMDAAAIEMLHARLDDTGKYKETVNSGLHECLTVESNIDQTGRALRQDIIISMFDEGVVAVVPVDTTLNPNLTGAYDINTLRVGRIVEWYPKHVRVELYNEDTGLMEEVVTPKRLTAIIENPLYEVMNAPNSTLQRLVRKISLLDVIDEQSGSGKLDLIFKLPYVIKSESRKEQARLRKQAIEDQLTNSKYGIAYVDATEDVIQLNRPAENNLIEQVQYLTTMLYSQLGLTESVFDGTADEATMLNYYNRTIEPIVNAITDEFTRKFLTKTARTQGQVVMALRDPFKLVPVKELADIADKFTRNEILSSNELRAIIGYKPVDDAAADELRNKNLKQAAGEINQNGNIPEIEEDEDGDL